MAYWTKYKELRNIKFKTKQFMVSVIQLWRQTPTIHSKLENMRAFEERVRPFLDKDEIAGVAS